MVLQSFALRESQRKLFTSDSAEKFLQQYLTNLTLCNKMAITVHVQHHNLKCQQYNGLTYALLCPNKYHHFVQNTFCSSTCKVVVFVGRIIDLMRVLTHYIVKVNDIM